MDAYMDISVCCATLSKFNPSSAEFFDSWWSTYINNRDQTAINVLRKILPHIMPLSPSPRSNGNSQCAATLGQNMKDGEEGTVSPSLADTRNKTSDVMEPQDRPVKFDNLDALIAYLMFGKDDATTVSATQGQGL
ncbi:hypothetical protein FXO38_07476 [Capsicum annuum]|nr:hypothetical protein FXO38_07476 [Capsicum annuum]KAF3677914.1 hypothetical protein FXO37_04603 [Capsicum annuum]